MLKGLFFTLPSVSINNTLKPVINNMASEKYQMIYYDTDQPGEESLFSYKPYPSNEMSYNSSCLDTDASFFRFAENIMDTSLNLMDFLIAEIEREKPDFILHPHLALWAKLVAAYFKLPAVTLSTTFIMDQRIMRPWFRKLSAGSDIDFDKMGAALRFKKKAVLLSKKLGLRKIPEIWDTYVSTENLNLSFILKELQPEAELLGDRYKFVGSPVPVKKNSLKEDLIYISLGTMLNNDPDFFLLCMEAVGQLGSNCILSVGYKVDIQALGAIPPNIRIERFVDQVEVLGRADLFLTSGGMASIQEAIYTGTPMLVIPQTTEQHITAEKVRELGIGICLSKKTLTKKELLNGIQEMRKNALKHKESLRSLLLKAPAADARDLSLNLIEKYLSEQQK